MARIAWHAWDVTVWDAFPADVGFLENPVDHSTNNRDKVLAGPRSQRFVWKVKIGRGWK
jgi:hypothetical protein